MGITRTEGCVYSKNRAKEVGVYIRCVPVYTLGYTTSIVLEAKSIDIMHCIHYNYSIATECIGISIDKIECQSGQSKLYLVTYYPYPHHQEAVLPGQQPIIQQYSTILLELDHKIHALL